MTLAGKSPRNKLAISGISPRLLEATLGKTPKGGFLHFPQTIKALELLQLFFLKLEELEQFQSCKYCRIEMAKILRRRLFQ
jgi:hypothetical protein